MEVNEIRDQEYEVQFFGFTVEDFMIAFKELIRDEVSRFAASMASSLIKKYSDDDPEIEHVKDVTKKLVESYMAVSEEPLKNFQIQLKDLMHIPSHTLLPSDAIQRIQYSTDDEDDIDDQLENLFQRLKRVKSIDLELRQELKTLHDVLPVLNRRVQELELLATEQKQNEINLHTLDSHIDNTIDSNSDFQNLLEDLIN